MFSNRSKQPGFAPQPSSSKHLSGIFTLTFSHFGPYPDGSDASLSASSDSAASPPMSRLYDHPDRNHRIWYDATFGAEMTDRDVVKLSGRSFTGRLSYVHPNGTSKDLGEVTGTANLYADVDRTHHFPVKKDGTHDLEGPGYRAMYYDAAFSGSGFLTQPEPVRLGCRSVLSEDLKYEEVDVREEALLSETQSFPVLQRVLSQTLEMTGAKRMLDNHRLDQAIVFHLFDSVDDFTHDLPQSWDMMHVTTLRLSTATSQQEDLKGGKQKSTQRSPLGHPLADALPTYDQAMGASGNAGEPSTTAHPSSSASRHNMGYSPASGQDSKDKSLPSDERSI